MEDIDRVLILAPHTDDGEIGCGGTVNRFIDDKEIYYVAFSIARKSSKARGFREDILADEVKDATSSLGIKSDHLFIKDYPVRNFPAHRQEILEDMIELRGEIEPHLIFVPAPEDVHQDHEVICEEATRAFKKRSILGYEEPWNQLENKNNFYIKLRKEDVKNKIKALKKYESQFGRSYIDEEFIWSQAKFRGTQIDEKYAECFNLIRFVY